MINLIATSNVKLTYEATSFIRTLFVLSKLLVLKVVYLF